MCCKHVSKLSHSIRDFAAGLGSALRALIGPAPLALLLGSWLVPAWPGQARPQDEINQAGFAQPPDSARPWVYWFWISGNITTNGITADLEAMKRAGIGGVLIMEVDQGAPAGEVKFASATWRKLFEFACCESKRLGLEINLNNDAGWCGSGGPWITPELSMKKLVWTETIVHGPGRIRDNLPQPETLQNFYRDIAVLAVPGSAPSGLRETLTNVVINPAVAELNWTNLVDGDNNTFVTLPRPDLEKPVQIDLTFSGPHEASCLKLQLKLGDYQTCFGELFSSTDGTEFRLVREFAAQASGQTFNFPRTAARYYRLVFRRADPFMADLKVTEIGLVDDFVIEDVLGKAGFIRKNNYPGPSDFKMPAIYARAPPELVIPRERVLDLTKKLTAAGQLNWEAPAGNWIVLRFGYTTTGKNNHPAPEPGRGLECDKLSRSGAEAMFRHWLNGLAKSAQQRASGALVTTHIDSWEVGSQNWTEAFREEFRHRRGYDLLGFLPVVTGRVVGSVEISERFLWDFRQTTADLLLTNYAGHFRKLAHRAGLRLSIEAYDGNPCEDISYGGRADEPVAEFWSWYPYGSSYGCIEMASAAHVYGKPIVSAEAFTAIDAERWRGHPYRVKVFGDWAYCQGINRFIFHRYALQPWTDPDRQPGMAMGPFGLHYERSQTWWEKSISWHKYLARCQYLLQQGKVVTDFCYLVPEMSPQRWRPPLDASFDTAYKYDACPPEMVLRDMSVADGRLALSSGASYRLLALPDHPCMTPSLLRRIRGLVQSGATVVGEPPQKSPSLTGYPACDQEVMRLSNELWGQNNGTPPRVRRFGKGRVIQGSTAQEFLRAEGLPADFEASMDPPAEPLRYIHKTIGDLDYYFVSNPNLRPVESVCSFRIEGRLPELWWPDSGRWERGGICRQTAGKVILPLRLESAESVFVLFRKDASLAAETLTSVSRNGAEVSGAIMDPAPLPPEPQAAAGTNAFTYGAWVRPTADIPLLEETNEGIRGYNLDRNDALFPPPAYEVFDDYRTSAPGLCVGKNGAAVFEGSNDYFVPLLVQPMAITNWTHIAVVYQSGQPSLYVNGQFARQGLKSHHQVHAPLGLKHGRGVAPFRGQTGPFQQFGHALTSDELRLWMGTNPPPKTVGDFPVIQVSRREKGQLQATVFEPGAYSLQTARGRIHEFQVRSLPPVQEIVGPWELSFPAASGAPERVLLDQLLSWSDHVEPGIKHFSGTAVYRQRVELSPEMVKPDQRLFLDLGKVEVMAEVTWNQKRFPVLWKPPFRVELTDCARIGANELRVEVVNLWINRLIGDEHLPEDTERNPDGSLRSWPEWLKAGQPSPSGRRSFTTWKLWKGSDPLEPSGLLGPVRLVPARVWSADSN